jgi:hypothetical protein
VAGPLRVRTRHRDADLRNDFLTIFHGPFGDPMARNRTMGSGWPSLSPTPVTQRPAPRLLRAAGPQKLRSLLAPAASLHVDEDIIRPIVRCLLSLYYYDATALL